MYLSSLELKNIRCFDNLKLDFDVQNETPEWTMILGDNSSGKTTLLRSIAIGLSNKYGSTALLENLPGDFISKKTKSANITAFLLDNKTPVKIETSIFKDYNDFEFIDMQKINLPEFGLFYPFDQIFVCAYGSNRPTKSTTYFDDNESKYVLYKSTLSLFNSGDFNNLELYLRRLYDDINKTTTNLSKYAQKKDSKLESELKSLKTRYNKIIDIFKNIFDLNEDEDIELTKQGITIRNIATKQETPISSSGDGYNSTLVWVMDLLSWSIAKNKFSVNDNITGVVLIDELERHLHPSWQRKIISHLRKVFPKVQFITTTHSPLIAAGMADIDNGRLLICKNGSYEEFNADNIRGLRADQILTHSIFGLETTRNIETEKILDRLEELVLKEKLTPAESREKRSLEYSLKEVSFETGETNSIRQEQKKLNTLVTLLKEKNIELDKKISLAQSMDINLEENFNDQD